MNKVLKTILVVICFITVLGIIPSKKSEVKAEEVLVVRTVEQGVHYVAIYFGDILIVKVPEL
jgi:hypothetical protein